MIAFLYVVGFCFAIVVFMIENSPPDESPARRRNLAPILARWSRQGRKYPLGAVIYV